VGDGVGVTVPVGDGVGVCVPVGVTLGLPVGGGVSSKGQAWLSWNCVGAFGAASVITAEAPVMVRPAGV
jgi:hypothetical protein